MIRQLIAIGALALASTTALADTAVYSGTLSVPNVGHAEYQEDIDNARVFSGIARAQQQFMGTIKSAISPPLMSMITAVDGYQPGSGYVNVSGPVTFALNSGVATFTGLNVGATLTAQASKYGVTATCTVQFATNPAMAVVGTIDPVAGTFTLGRIDNFSLSSSSSCSSSLDWVPIIGSIVDSFITKSLDKMIAEKTQLAYNALNNIGALAPIHFVGIDKIPDAVLYYNGIDYGAQLKSGLANLFYSTNFSVTIGDPTYYITGTKGYPHIAYSSDLVMSFSINEFRFQLLDKRTYVDEVYCPSTSRYCFFF